MALGVLNIITLTIHGAYTGITEDKLKSSIYYATLRLFFTLRY